MLVRIGGHTFPPTIGTSEAAALLGASEETLQRLTGTGLLPIEPLKVGARLRWPTALIAQALGLPVEIVVDEAGERERPDAPPPLRAVTGSGE